MIFCVCLNISEDDINNLLSAGFSVTQALEELNVGADCGSCLHRVGWTRTSSGVRGASSNPSAGLKESTNTMDHACALGPRRGGSDDRRD